jgi:hypothetical protein
MHMFVGIDDTSGIGKHCRLLHLRCHLNDKIKKKKSREPSVKERTARGPPTDHISYIF